MSGCEALYHHPDCPCPTCPLDICDRCPNGVTPTTDHFTPRRIRIAWKIRPNGDTLEDTSNLQLVNPRCHRPKDQSSAARAMQVRRLKKGKAVSQADYEREVMPHDLRDAATGKPIRLNPGERVVFKNK